ncbi:MAG TPA: EF-P lysine aminoacylase EpmA [Hyphomicrobiaceae bacterium]|nr:EF-P lysine aminoacylase EpmA [Hyphomicrobiaceae bacterium]
MSGPSPWWSPSRHEDRRPRLILRNRIKAAFRAWFEGEGFTEVETAALQVSPGNEAHLHAFATSMIGDDGRAVPRYLHTSPEFACKKLIAAGETRIFTFAPVYRNRERGPLHHPEFAMLEWYRVGAPYHRLIEDCAELMRRAALITGSAQWQFREATADAAAQPVRVTVADAFERFAGIHLLEDGIGANGSVDRDRFAAAASARSIRVAADDTWSDVFSRVLVERVEPGLRGMSAPVVLDEYPAHEAALARRVPRDPRVSERFELYACGVELANAFGELTDAGEQRRRFEAEMDERERVWGERYPIDDALLAALGTMPPTSGIALGFDRLVMLATGASRVDDVIWTPFE